MILIADASALIALATCDSLALLDAVFGSVLVPEAVHAEVTEVDKPQSARLRSYLHGKVRAVDMQHFVCLDAFADVDETQAMLLYKEMAADYLLIDDRRGRRIARIRTMSRVLRRQWEKFSEPLPVDLTGWTRNVVLVGV